MSKNQIDEVIAKAKFIVSGYAFIKMDDGLISIVDLNAPHHAVVINLDGEVMETNMHDIEQDIVLNSYWQKNKQFITDPTYA